MSTSTNSASSSTQPTDQPNAQGAVISTPTSATVAPSPAQIIAEQKPDVADGMMLGEEARDYYPPVKNETNGDINKPPAPAQSEVDRTSIISNCGTVEDDSATVNPSRESTADDQDVEGEASDTEQPGPADIRKTSAAPQIDAQQLRCDPDFAVICSFINKFFTLMRMEPVSFSQLENMFTTLEDGRVSKELVDLHLKLLRRSIVKTVSNDSFEKCLLKYLSSTGLLPSEKRQLETYGYVHMSISSKLKILRALCELQLDHNLRLRESIPPALRAMDMRHLVTGVDKDGLAYYFQIDSKFGLRLYTTEQDDESGTSWTLVASDMTDLESLITKLKEQDLGYVKNPNDKRDFNKPGVGDPEHTLTNMVTKKGTFVDMFLDDAAIKRMRERMIKEKEERRNRRNARMENPQETHEEVHVEEEEKHEDTEEGDRRVLPRRSASQKAQTNIRKYISPKKTHEKKPVNEAHEELIKEEAKRDSSTPAVSDDSDGSAGSSENEDDGSASSDDEFKPKTSRKSTGKRRGRRKKVVDDVDDEDESGEEEEEVRRRVEGDFACGACKRSDNEEILLLCDNCDDAWHTTCLKPPLWFVPAGKWYCPKCEHGMLIECLTYVQEMLSIQQKKAAAEEKKASVLKSSKISPKAHVGSGYVTKIVKKTTGRSERSSSCGRKAAADRFRREMEYIGVSLNNIIPTTLKQSAVDSSSSSSSDDGQRRSKRKAVKKIAPNAHRYAPLQVQTVAEGRSRRSVKKVDYKFSEFDTVIKEACRLNESPPPPEVMNEVSRPQGGAGRGKDMANILEAQKQRDGSEGTPRASTGIPPRLPKHRRKLNDLNVNDDSDSDSDEYKANESDEEEADEDAQSSSDYVPSETELRRERAGGGGRRSLLKPTQSDEDFVVSGSDDSYTGTRRRKKKKGREKSRKRSRWNSDDDSDEEEDDEDTTYSDDSEAKRKKRRRVEPESDEETNDEDDEVQLEEDDEDSDAPRTRAGRPLRKAVVKSKAVLREELEDEEDSSEDEETENGEPVTEKEADEAKKAKKRKITSDSESDVFEPDEEAENDEDEEDEEEEEDQNKDTQLRRAPPIPGRVSSSSVVKKAADVPAPQNESDEESDMDSDNDLDLKPKAKKPRLEENPEGKPEAVTKSAPLKDNGAVNMESKPKPVTAPKADAPADAAFPKSSVSASGEAGDSKSIEKKPLAAEASESKPLKPLNAKTANSEPSVSESSPSLLPAPKAASESKEEKPRVSPLSSKEEKPSASPSPSLTPASNPYVPATIVTESKVLATVVSTVPTKSDTVGVETLAPSYVTSERTTSVALTTLVPNPYATAPPIPQMPYGPPGAIPFVSNPYAPYPPNTTPFPPGPPAMAPPHIGYIPGVVPNPYGQQPSIPPSKTGTRDLRSL